MNKTSSTRKVSTVEAIEDCDQQQQKEKNLNKQMMRCKRSRSRSQSKRGPNISYKSDSSEDIYDDQLDSDSQQYEEEESSKVPEAEQNSLSASDNTIDSNEEEEEESEEEEDQDICTDETHSSIGVIKKEEEDNLQKSTQIQQPAKETDDVPHFVLKKGELFMGRFMSTEVLGEGTFGRVLKVVDIKTHIPYAMKVIKPLKRHIENARIEAQILQAIQSMKDEGEDTKVVTLIEHFPHGNHYCLVFELLGLSVYEVIQRNQFTGFPLDKLRIILYDLLDGLSFMHDINLTHTDLKPENIIFKSLKMEKMKDGKVYPEEFTIKIIDLGGATFDDQHHSTLINTRQYRAPEVILNCQKWDEKSDIWSVACIAVELFSGQLFFKTRKNDYEHLVMIEKQCGPIPYSMVKSIKNDMKKLFVKRRTSNKNQQSLLIYPLEADDEMKLRINNMKRLDDIFPSDSKKYSTIKDLIQKMMQVHPNDRITADEALKHDFFSCQ